MELPCRVSDLGAIAHLRPTGWFYELFMKSLYGNLLISTLINIVEYVCRPNDCMG